MRTKTFFPNKKPAMLMLILALPLMAMLPWKVKKLREYFPMREGTMWQYNLYNPVDHEIMIYDSIFCQGDTVLNGERYGVIAGNSRKEIFPGGYWRFEKTVLYRYHTTKKCDVLFTDFSNKKGERTTRDTVHYHTRVLSTDTTYTVPGIWKVNTSDEPLQPTTYTNVYCVEWKETGSAERTILFFKAGWGLVGLKMESGEELYLQGYAVK